MADVAANRTDAAVQRWHKSGDGQFEQQHADTTAKSSIRLVGATCGTPSDATALNGDNPEPASLTNGDRTFKQFIFVYRAKTSLGVRKFNVTVQADESGEYHVAGFGCGKVKVQVKSVVQ